MNLLLVPFLVPFLFFLPGYLICRTIFRTPGAFTAGERWFLPLALSVCVTTWIGFTLAEFGAFSLLNLSAPLFLLCAALFLVGRKRFAAWQLGGWKPDRLFLAITVLAFFLFMRPAEMIIGSSDAGTYINTGANIARTGAIAIHDAQVAQLPPDPAKTFYWQLINPFMLYTQVRLPGFFVADQAQGLVLPQFLHFYPVWLAMWDALVGVQWGLYATPLIALLASVGFYFLARELLGQNFARLAYLLVVVMVPQFWFARYPVAEGMTQFLVLTGMWAVLRMYRQQGDRESLTGSAPGDNNRIGLGLLAGVAFGQVFFTRADAILLLVPLGLFGLVLILARRWRVEHWALFGAFGMVLAQAVAHMLVFAPNYLYFQYSHAMRMQNVDKLLRIQLPDAERLFASGEYALLVLGAIGLGCVGVFVLDRMVQFGRRRWGARVRKQMSHAERYLRLGGAVLVVALVVAFYFVLPRPESLYAYIGGLTPAGEEGNLIKFGWYFSPIGIVLATVGAVIVILRDLNARNVFWYGTAALFAALYLDELYSTPHYIYTMRHYIPLVLPLFVVLAARALQWLWHAAPLGQRGRVLRWAAVGALALWLCYDLYAMGIVDASRAQGLALRLPFVTTPTSLGFVRVEPFENSVVGVNEVGGAYEQIRSLADTLDPSAVVVFSAGRDEPAVIATPLKYIFGRDAFVTVFNNPPGNKVAAMIDQWRMQGRDVILAYGTNGGKLQIPNYTLEHVGDYSFDVPQLAFAYDFMPRSTWRVNLNYALYRAVPSTAPQAEPVVVDFGGADFPYLASGFLERAPEANARWMGRIPANSKTSDPKTVGAGLWIPALPEAQTYALTLRARAPRAEVRLQVRSGENNLGSAKLTQDFAEYTIQFPRSKLKPSGDGYTLELSSQATLQEGRILGAELESLRIEQVIE